MPSNQWPNLRAYSLLALFLLGLSCRPDEASTCLKGRFIANYCEASVVQLLTPSKMGATWKQVDGRDVPNCLLASLDSVAFRGGTLPDVFNTSRDSVFYFHYRAGRYPQKAYVLCQDLPGITITASSAAGCRF